MERIQRLNQLLQRLVAVPEWRFAIGLRIRFNHPTLLYQTYPEDWVAYYAQNALVFTDPAVAWGMTNNGVCVWDDLASTDAAGVLQLAARYGLNHGIVVSIGEVATRSLGFFASPKAPLSPDLRDLAQQVVEELHGITAGFEDLPSGELAPFRAVNDDLRKATGI
jgi:LuxR family transcriptional regulator